MQNPKEKKKPKNQPHKPCKLPEGQKKSMAFAKGNKLHNKFNNNNNNNIMKMLQIAKTCANSRKKELIKM